MTYYLNIYEFRQVHICLATSSFFTFFTQIFEIEHSFINCLMRLMTYPNPFHLTLNHDQSGFFKRIFLLRKPNWREFTYASFFKFISSVNCRYKFTSFSKTHCHHRLWLVFSMYTNVDSCLFKNLIYLFGAFKAEHLLYELFSEIKTFLSKPIFLTFKHNQSDLCKDLYLLKVVKWRVIT